MTAETRSKRFVFVQRSHSCCGVRKYEFRYWPLTGRVEKQHEEGAALLAPELPNPQMQPTGRGGPELRATRHSAWPTKGIVDLMWREPDGLQLICQSLGVPATSIMNIQLANRDLEASSLRRLRKLRRTM
jgi:hypothetical protein